MVDTASTLDQAKALLERCQQPELLELIGTLAPEKQLEVAQKVIRLNSVTPTGMEQYLARGRKLLADSAANVNPFADFKPEVPTGIFLRPGEDKFAEMEERGLDELSKVGIVLIAGGLGERLGFSSIKISLPVVTIEDDYSYLRYYAEYALALK
jgi:UDP-sugar pyrophosphorylase